MNAENIFEFGKTTALSNKKVGFEICLVASDRPAEGLEVAATAGHKTVLVDRNIYQSKQEHEATRSNN